MNLKTRFTYNGFAILVLLLGSLAATAQTTNPKYDKALADSLGADAYGMKMYVLVLLKSGATKVDDKSKSDSLFAGHMQNIRRLVNAGKLVVAGPLEENEKNYRGIFILNVKTTDEARVLLQSDPAIKANVLDADLYGWYGSAALPLYLPASEKVGRQSF